jgi:hypothetical protein
VESVDQKIVFGEWEVKGKIAPPNGPLLTTKIVDFRLKYCIPKENAKNSTSGRGQRQPAEGSMPNPIPPKSPK